MSPTPPNRQAMAPPSTMMSLRSCVLVAVIAIIAIIAPGLAPSALGQDHGEKPTSRPAEPESILVPPSAAEVKSADRQELERELAHIDPLIDGFEGEALNSNGGKILKLIGKVLADPTRGSELTTHVSPDFASGALRADALETRFASPGLTVSTGDAGPLQFTGKDGALELVTHLGRPFDRRELITKFKIVEVQLESEAVGTTRAIYLAMGTGPGGTVQQNAQWSVRWDLTRGVDDPYLLGIDLIEYEENAAPTKLYDDCTQSVFESPAALERIRRGIHSWWGQIDTGMGFSFYGDYAVVLGDFNGDSLDDLYLCQPGSLPNMLLRHEPDGTLTDVTEGSGVDLLNDTPSAVMADFDNDGRQDLVVATLLSLVFMRGDGTGRFTPVGQDSTNNTVSLSAADYDGDGLLDLYICRYSSSTRATVSGTSLYDSNDGKPNVLLRNEGDFAFRDVTVESGIDHNNRKFSFAAVWEDYDNDGDPDVYVANDFGRNNLYRNDGHTFIDVATESGAEDMAAGMGATWADFNLDGNMDLYVSNMFSSAGGRIVDKPQIVSAAGADAVQPLQRFAKGNTLLENRGDGSFDDVSDRAGITMGRWSWGGEFLDLNNDGWEDLVVPNGFVTNTNTKDL